MYIITESTDDKHIGNYVTFNEETKIATIHCPVHHHHDFNYEHIIRTNKTIRIKSVHYTIKAKILN